MSGAKLTVQWPELFLSRADFNSPPPPPPPLLSLPQNMSDYKENRTHTFSFNLRVLTARLLMAPLRLRIIHPCGQEHVEGLQRSSCCCGPRESSCKMMKTW